MTKSHTPGPWFIGDRGYIHNTPGRGPETKLIAAVITSNQDTSEEKANAFLISEAPELLDVLRLVKETYLGEINYSLAGKPIMIIIERKLQQIIMEKIDLVIAKAQGKA